MALEYSAEPLQSPASPRLEAFLRAHRQAWQQGGYQSLSNLNASCTSTS
jgi:hypothetical protein